MRKLKVLKGIFSVLTCFTFCTSIWAQSEQIGYVLEYQDINHKTPLANVEIVASNAGSTISDKRGRFTLRFRTLLPGDKINFRRIVKPGYEIFNKTALENLRISNQKEPIEIILIKSEHLAEARRTLILNATNQANLQLEQKQQDLKIKYNKNEFDEQEYNKRLKEVQQAYDEKLENIDNYIDRFVHIDLSDLTEQEAIIVNLVQEGKFEEAIAIYEKNDQVSRLALLGNNSKKLEEDAQILRESMQQMEAEKAEVFNSLNRQIDLLRMQGGKENLQRVLQLLHDIAYTDTTDFEPIFTYGRELRKHTQYSEALQLYRDLQRWTLLSQDSLQYQRAKMFEGVSLVKMGQYDEAKGMMREAMVNFVKQIKLTPDSLYFIPDLAYGSHIFGQLLCKYELYEDGRNYFHYGLSLIYKFRQQEAEGTNHEISSQYANMLVRAADGLCHSQYLDESISLSREAIKILESLYAEQPTLYRESLAYAWTNLGKFFFLQGCIANQKSENAFKKSLKYYEEGFDSNPDLYRRHSAECRMYLGDLYYSKGDILNAIECYEWSLDIFTEAQKERGDIFYNEKISTLYHSLGSCYYKSGDYEKTLKYNKLALDITEQYYNEDSQLSKFQMAACLRHMAVICDALGKDEEALSYCRRAMSIQPDEEKNRTLLNKLLEKNNIKE